jgi:uncharacterized membrane protein
MTRAMRALALAGVAVSAYLTYVHYAGVAPICTTLSDCKRVQSSSYAEFLGVPVALLGALGYAGILGALQLPGERGLLATALLAFTGFGYSLYLTYLEAFEIKAACQWCVVSALLMAALAALAARRVLKTPLPTA